MNLNPILENRPVKTSVPCRIDFGGTLDISTFYLPMAALKPSTLNIALDMRTHVTLNPWTPNRVKISSTGFETHETPKGEACFDHAMGLMSAIVNYFDVHGVHVHIHSTSPTKSALGGSSSAAVAMIRRLLPGHGKRPGSGAYLLAGPLSGSLGGRGPLRYPGPDGSGLWRGKTSGNGPLAGPVLPLSGIPCSRQKKRPTSSMTISW